MSHTGSTGKGIGAQWPNLCYANSDDEPCLNCFVCKMQGHGMIKLFQARRDSVGAIFTAEEFSNLVRQGTLSGLLEQAKPEFVEKLSAVFEKFDGLSNEEDKNQMRCLTLDETKTWCKGYEDLADWVARNSMHCYLEDWLKPFKPDEPHPLDGEFDPNIDYSSVAEYVGGNIEACCHLNCSDIEERAKAYYFHMIEVLQKLEQCKAESKPAVLVYQNHCALLKAMSALRRARPDDVPAVSQSQAQPLLTAGQKISRAISSGKGVTLTRSEVLQVLRFCENIARPKAEKVTRKPEPSPQRKTRGKKARGATKSESSDPITSRIRYLKGPKLDIDAGDILIPPSRTAEELAPQIKDAKAKGDGLVCNPQTTFDILFGLRFMFSRAKTAIVDPVEDPLHPQVTACNKLIVSDSKHEDCTLDSEEVIYLAMIWLQYLAIRASLLDDELVSTARSVPAAAAETTHTDAGLPPPESKVSLYGFNKEEMQLLARGLFFGPEAWPAMKIERLHALRNGDAVRNLFQILARTGRTGQIQNENIMNVLWAFSMLFYYGDIPLVDPESSPLHHQVTGLNKLLAIYAAKETSDTSGDFSFTEKEILCLLEILEQIPSVEAKFSKMRDRIVTEEKISPDAFFNVGKKVRSEQVAPKITQAVSSNKEHQCHEIQTKDTPRSPDCPLHGGSSDQAIKITTEVESTTKSPEMSTTEHVSHETSGESTIAEPFPNLANTLGPTETQSGLEPSNNTVYTSDEYYVSDSEVVLVSPPTEAWGDAPQDTTLLKIRTTLGNLWEKYNWLYVLARTEEEHRMKISRNDLTTIVSELKYLIRNLDRYELQREYQIKGLRVEHSAETSKLRQQFENDKTRETESLNLEHAAKVSDLQRQLLNEKARAETKYDTLRQDFGVYKEKAKIKDTQAAAEKKVLEARIEARDATIKELKENGKKFIQGHMDRADRFKQKYEDEVASNAIVKLDYEATTATAAKLEAEVESLTAKAKGDASKIAKFEREIGGLRSKQAISAYDKRGISEMQTLKSEIQTLESENTRLKDSITLLQSRNNELGIRNENLSTALEALKKSYKKIRAEIDDERAHPGGKAAMIESLQTRVAELESREVALENYATGLESQTGTLRKELEASQARWQKESHALALEIIKTQMWRRRMERVQAAIAAGFQSIEAALKD